MSISRVSHNFHGHLLTSFFRTEKPDFFKRTFGHLSLEISYKISCIGLILAPLLDSLPQFSSENPLFTSGRPYAYIAGDRGKKSLFETCCHALAGTKTEKNRLLFSMDSRHHSRPPSRRNAPPGLSTKPPRVGPTTSTSIRTRPRGINPK